jgi:4-diphosphocytidyl-2-C-methyl-D-erythritol kinase
VQGALAALAPTRHWRITIKKAIPLAAGLGGGSSDAATALRLANAQLERPLPAAELHELAAQVGADVPFFLVDGRGATKPSTAAVYAAFDARAGAKGFAGRAAALRKAVAAVGRPRDLASLPANDLASSPFADRLRALGAFRADVTGAGPVVYGLFTRRSEAQTAARALRGLGRTWITVPAWYG